MVSPSEAIIYEWTVVVEHFNASVTDCTVEARFRLDNFVVDTEVVQT
jgi:hypothetical protein